MIKKELELLIALQDLDMMIEEVSAVKRLGFNAEGEDNLLHAREEFIFVKAVEEFCIGSKMLLILKTGIAK